MEFVPGNGITTRPARILGTITYADPVWQILFVHDGSASFYLYRPGDSPLLVSGDSVLVDGEVQPGGFAPIVVTTNITVRGRGTIPPPRPATMDDLLGGKLDSQWIEISAVVRSVSVFDQHLRIEFSTMDQLQAFLPLNGRVEVPRGLEDARVRIRGVCGTRFNSRGQLLSYRLFVPGIDSIEIIEPAAADPFQVTSSKLGTVLSYKNRTSYGHRIKFSGTVTLCESTNSFYMQDETGGARVETRDAAGVKAGDRIEAVGFPKAGAASPLLLNAQVRRIGDGNAVVPIRVKSDELISGDWDCQLVTVEASVVERLAKGGTLTFTLQRIAPTSGMFFEARYPTVTGGWSGPELEPGGRVAVTGVCSVILSDDQAPIGMQVSIRGPEDIQVLQAAPWFTPQRLLRVLGVSVGLLLIWRVHGLWRERNLNARYQMIVESASDGVFTADHDGRFLTVNEAWENLTGRNATALKSARLIDLIPPQRRAVFNEWWRKLWLGESVPALETDLSVGTETSLWIEINSRLVRNGGTSPMIEAIARDITARRRAENLQRGQRDILELIAMETPLADVLTKIALFCEEQSPGMLCSILLVDEEARTLRHGAAPSLPDEYNHIIDGLRWGEGVGSCGTAVARKKPVFVGDISTSPLWINYRGLAEKFGLRACWSTPLLSSANHVLGTIAVYYRESRDPTSPEIELITMAGSLAAIAIERTRTTEAVRNMSAFQSNILEAASVSIISTTPSGSILSVNRAAETMLGYRAAELVGTSIVEKLHVEAELNAQAGLWSARLGRPIKPGIEALTACVGPSKADQREWKYRRQDGSFLPVMVSATYLTGSGGGSIGFLFVASDLTERKKDEAARSELEQQLRQSQKMEALGTLAGGIAHDFNNVLASILCCAELIETDPPTRDGQSENIKTIVDACGRAQEMVAQLLAFSRPERPERTPVRLVEVVADALRLIRPTLPPGVEIRNEVEPSDYFVRANVTQIHQILVNLCANAAHAMRGQRGQIELTKKLVEVDSAAAQALKLGSPGRYLCLSVADTGHGMDERTLQRIFEPFFTTKSQGEGTGLGLAVAHGIMKGHDGAITVSSSPGEGTRFDLYFPVIPPGEVVAAKPTENRARGTGQRVLLVDDEPSLVNASCRLLAHMGFQPTAFTNPVEAWAAIEAAPRDFDVLLTDLSMPQMTGIDLAKRVRKVRPEMPIIICSGHRGRIDMNEAEKTGITSILDKPFRAEDLARSLNAATGHAEFGGA